MKRKKTATIVGVLEYPEGTTDREVAEDLAKRGIILVPRKKPKEK